MRTTILPNAIILTKAHRAAVSMLAKGVYYGLSIASKVFLIFTTQLYSCLCNYNAKVFISCQEGSIATGILSTPNIPLSSLPVCSKWGVSRRHMMF